MYTILGSQYQCEVCIPTMSTPSMTICSLEQGIVKANIELWHQQTRHDNVINIRNFFASSFKYQIKRGLFLCHKQSIFGRFYRFEFSGKEILSITPNQLNLFQRTQTGSNLFKPVQTCSNLIKMDQIGLNLIKLD